MYRLAYTVSAPNGFNGSVSLSGSGLPSGASAMFNPASITGSGSSTMNVTTSTSTPTGSFALTITGTSGTLTHTATVTLVVNPVPTPDFSISATPSSQTVSLVVNSPGPPGFSVSASPSSETIRRPNSTTYTVTVTALNGFTGTVTFSARGLPSGASASFNPRSVAGSGSSTLTIKTSSSTSTGTFDVRIRGSSGGTTHSTTVPLAVQ